MKNKIGKKEIFIIIGIIVIIVTGLILSMCNRKNPFDGENKVNVNAVSKETGKEVDIVYETMEPPKQSMYINKELSAKDSNGGVLQIGINDVIADGLIINPRYTLSNSDYKIGYYISTLNKSNFYYSQEKPTTIENLSKSSNVIIDWTYDRLYNADYNDENDYGVSWHPAYDDKNFKSETFKIAVVDMTTHNIIGTYNVTVHKENGKYTFKEMYCTDLKLIPEDKFKSIWNKRILLLKADEIDLTSVRQKLIDKAVSEIKSENYIAVTEDFNIANSTVELVETTYHLNFLNDKHDVTYIGQIKYPIWAVTINSKIQSIGHYTFYFSKDDMECLGCDFFYLDTLDELKQFNKSNIYLE